MIRFFSRPEILFHHTEPIIRTLKTLITKILTSTASNDTFWSLWLNFRYVNVAGCQARIKNDDSVLWALIPAKFDAQGGMRDLSVYERLAYSRNSAVVYTAETQRSSHCGTRRFYCHGH
jgi:hypothetical protein